LNFKYIIPMFENVNLLVFRILFFSLVSLIVRWDV